MKTKCKKIIFFLIISLCIIRPSIGQNIFNYDKKYYDGYIITNDNPSTKGVEPNTKIECKIKNEMYYYYPSDNRSGVFYVDYMTADGKKEKMWWADVAEIKTDSFYYKLFTGFKNNVGNGFSLINRRVLEGKINYWWSAPYAFLEKDSTIYFIPYGETDFLVGMINPKKKVEERKKKFREFFIDLVSDDTELVAKINGEGYIDFKVSNFIHYTVMKIIKEYNEWYKKNH
jgi:hypothetical protein